VHRAHACRTRTHPTLQAASGDKQRKLTDFFGPPSVNMHATSGRRCLAAGCTTSASCAQPGERPKYCSNHKRLAGPGAVNVTNGKCRFEFEHCTSIIKERGMCKRHAKMHPTLDYRARKPKSK
jgi:hypothetical protein